MPDCFIKEIQSKLRLLHSRKKLLTLKPLPGIRPGPTGKVSQFRAPQDLQRIWALLRLRPLSIICKLKVNKSVYVA